MDIETLSFGAPIGRFSDSIDSALDHGLRMPLITLEPPLVFTAPHSYNEYFTTSNTRFNYGKSKLLWWGEKEIPVIVFKPTDHEADIWLCWATDAATDVRHKAVKVDT